MPNSDTVFNAMADVVQHRQQRDTILNMSSEMYQLDGDDCDAEFDSLSLLVDLFVSENDIRIFKDFNQLSRNKFEAVCDRISVQVISDRSSGRGSR